MQQNIKESLRPFLTEIPAVADAAALRETMWLNDAMQTDSDEQSLPVSDAQIADAEARLIRFAPYLAKAFPETGNGIIESPLVRILVMQKALQAERAFVPGQLFMKLDSSLPVAGSVKARGGVYEVLKHAETLALEAGMLKVSDHYEILCEQRFRDLFSRYTVQVGSTGNLGLSIGIMSAKLGFRVIVHMSADAKQWKKNLLREKGVTVIEYQTNYCEAVNEGRRRSAEDPKSYFVDDEKSIDLFLGYAVAGHRLAQQLQADKITVDASHPLFVSLPCGIGGAPGGITYGLKRIYGEHVNCFFTEPTEACCMLLGVATGLHENVSVQDFGISGKTEADGLAVTRPSALVGHIVGPMLSGVATIRDQRLYQLMAELYRTEHLFIEPSSCACFAALLQAESMKKYCREKGLDGCLDQITHIVWATGGSLVPEKVREEYLKKAEENT